MQTTGYMIIGGEKVLVLCRQKRVTRQFKIRASGKDGNHFSDEECFFEDVPEELEHLRKGAVIEL